MKNISWSLLDLKFLQRGLWVCIALVFGFILIDFIQSLVFRPEFIKTSSLHKDLSLKSISQVPFSEYKKTFENSVFFGPYSREVKNEIQRSSIGTLLKDIRVKGIVVLDGIEAIVEDAKTRKTFIVRVGDKINELTIKSLTPLSVVFGYFKEEKEIRLE